MAETHTPGTVGHACEGESLDGHQHQEEVREYVRICARNHFRRGWLCGACARPLYHRGPGVVTCAKCPEDDPRPGVLMLASEWKSNERRV